ncbi:MAG TPA: hypothetical protein VN457_02735, partial [Chlamydiales bacterium]|nr:hypothetical protein [Chlamydiales bacterium]
MNKIQEINQSQVKTQTRTINFVKEGEKVPKKPVDKTELSGLLVSARDWVCDFDLPDLYQRDFPYTFPHDISLTGNKRPDGYIWSKTTRTCVLIELTVPMEENLEKRRLEKTERYDELRASAVDSQIHQLNFEVGCRGFIPRHFTV